MFHPGRPLLDFAVVPLRVQIVALTCQTKSTLPCTTCSFPKPHCTFCSEPAGTLWWGRNVYRLVEEVQIGEHQLMRGHKPF